MIKTQQYHWPFPITLRFPTHVLFVIEGYWPQAIETIKHNKIPDIKRYPKNGFANDPSPKNAVVHEKNV